MTAIEPPTEMSETAPTAPQLEAEEIVEQATDAALDETINLANVTIDEATPLSGKSEIELAAYAMRFRQVVQQVYSGRDRLATIAASEKDVEIISRILSEISPELMAQVPIVVEGSVTGIPQIVTQSAVDYQWAMEHFDKMGFFTELQSMGCPFMPTLQELRLLTMFDTMIAAQAKQPKLLAASQLPPNIISPKR